MRRVAALTLCAFAVLSGIARATDIEATSRIDNVTVYPDGATVTRIITANLPAGDNTLLTRDLPLSIDPSSLRVEGEGGAKLTIGAIDIRTPRPLPPTNLPEIDQRIEALRDQRAALDGAIAAANARRKFAERFAESAPAGIGDKGEARPLSEWRSAFSAIAEEVAAADNAVREAKVKQRDIDRTLTGLEAERRATPPRKLELRIDLNATAAASTTLRVTYAVRGARWTPLYDARLDTGSKTKKPSLELIRRAEISQSTGEDWNDVALAVSTVRTASGGTAPELRPLIAQYPAPRPLAELQRDAIAAAAPTARAKSEGVAAPAPAVEQEAVVEASGFQVVFRIPGRISLPAQQGAKSFRVSSTQLAPELIVRAVPALDETAFLEAGFKNAEEAPLLPGNVSIYRDGIFVGRSPMRLTPKDETVRLGFGADDKVKIARTVVRKTESTAGIIGSSKIDEREFKTTVRNGHDFPIKVSLEDQIPVSESEDITVTTLPVTTPPTARDLRDRRGVLEWAFEAAPGETREIKLGWQVRWPKDRSVILSPAPR
ncbi:MAG: mucoidy inhibitor MuiA family protein [Pseudolabrys sp.]|nr:mucoidy inhibitor MuiA family protein [Pseudolabrys sp.]